MLCELGLVYGAEALRCSGDERTAKLREAVARMEEGLQLLRKIGHVDMKMKEYEKELEKLRTEPC